MPISVYTSLTKFLEARTPVDQNFHLTSPLEAPPTRDTAIPLLLTLSLNYPPARGEQRHRRQDHIQHSNHHVFVLGSSEGPTIYIGR